MLDVVGAAAGETPRVLSDNEQEGLGWAEAAPFGESWRRRGPAGGVQNTDGSGNEQEQAGQVRVKPKSSKPGAYQTNST